MRGPQVAIFFCLFFVAAPSFQAEAGPVHPHAPASVARRWRVTLDAGHGAQKNAGAQNALCEFEQDFALALSGEVARKLEATGQFRVRTSRGAHPVPYKKRVQDAETWKADAFISLHFDARGEAALWTTPSGLQCWRNDAGPGFSVLWSDEGSADLLQARGALARAIAAQMVRSGFVPYGGIDYEGLYAADSGQAGVFINRHVPGARIYLLRSPRVPSVVIETHHGLDLAEVQLWKEPATRERFADALATALSEVLGTVTGRQAKN